MVREAAWYRIFYCCYGVVVNSCGARAMVSGRGLDVTEKSDIGGEGG